MRFGRQSSIYTGIPHHILCEWLREAQWAQVELSRGGRVVTATYAQGDGNKSVTYTPASLPNLIMMIKQLQQELGIVRHAREPFRVGFR